MIYTIHMDRDAKPIAEDRTGESRFDSLTAIPEGKATWALIAPPFWLAYHRLWWHFSLYCLVAFFFLSLLATPFFLVTMLVGGLPGLYLLIEGHQLRREQATQNGLHHMGTVEAVNETEALERFLASWQEAKTDIAPSPSFTVGNTKSDNLAFGIFPETGS